MTTDSMREEDLVRIRQSINAILLAKQKARVTKKKKGTLSPYHCAFLYSLHLMYDDE